MATKAEDSESVASPMAGLVETMGKLGGPKGAMARMLVSERRSEAMNLKVNLLCEKAGVDWKSDPKYLKLKAKWKAEDEGSG